MHLELTLPVSRVRSKAGKNLGIETEFDVLNERPSSNFPNFLSFLYRFNERNLGAEGKNQLGGSFPYGNTLLIFLFLLSHCLDVASQAWAMRKLPYFLPAPSDHHEHFIPNLSYVQVVDSYMKFGKWAALLAWQQKKFWRKCDCKSQQFPWYFHLLILSI